MSALYANLQKLAGWIDNGNVQFIDLCITECDKSIKTMLDSGKGAEVRETLLIAIKAMPKEMGFYMAKSCINRGVSLI